MRLSDLFNVFSKRHAPRPQAPKPLPASFRNRVFMRCRDLFTHESPVFWGEIQSRLAYLHGRPNLSEAHAGSPLDDALIFLQGCDDAHFLDFVEYIFQTQAFFHAPAHEQVIDDVNEFLQQDDLPYALTDFVWTKGVSIQFGHEYETMTLTGYPQIIRRDSEVIYQNAILPTLQLLRGPAFEAANREFLQALDDGRKGDYGDCLTKCGSAFESVLKVICTRRQWAYAATDTASPLLKTVIANSGIEPFLEQPLMVVATLRNRLSTAHGAGVASREVSEAKAEYAINATAAAILLLVNEAG